MIGDVIGEDRVRVLEALARRVAEELDSGPAAKDVAPLVRRLESLIAEIEGLKDSDGDTLADELERRRMARSGGVAGAEAAGS